MAVYDSSNSYRLVPPTMFVFFKLMILSRKSKKRKNEDGQS